MRVTRPISWGCTIKKTTKMSTRPCSRVSRIHNTTVRSRDDQTKNSEWHVPLAGAAQIINIIKIKKNSVPVLVRHRHFLLPNLHWKVCLLYFLLPPGLHSRTLLGISKSRRPSIEQSLLFCLPVDVLARLQLVHLLGDVVEEMQRPKVELWGQICLRINFISFLKFTLLFTLQQSPEANFF